jgi:metal-responsive CopG/Arc/MetJ family transcriptional regulator
MARKKSKNKNAMTQVSVSIPLRILEGLDALARADNRNRSNYITMLIAQAIQRAEKEQ